MGETNNEEFLTYLFGGDKLPHTEKEQVAVGTLYAPTLHESTMKAGEYGRGIGEAFFKPGLVDKEKYDAAPVTKDIQGRPKKPILDSQIRTLTSLWADIDVGVKASGRVYTPSKEAAEEILNSLPLPPNFIVHSGTGIHAYWRLTSSLWAQSHRDIVKRWQQYLYEEFGKHGYVIDRIGNVSRWMRVPGTIHKKAGKVVEWVTNQGEARPLSDFDEFIDIGESDGTQLIEDDLCKVVGGARPPEDIFRKLMEKPHVRTLWERTTPRDSLSEYAAELACIALWEGWEPQDTANLLVRFEEENHHSRKGGKLKLHSVAGTVHSAMRYVEENPSGHLLDTASAVIKELEPIAGAKDFLPRAIDILVGGALLSVDLSHTDHDIVINYLRKETGVKKSAIEADIANKRRALMVGNPDRKIAPWLKGYNERYAYCLSGDTLKGGVLYLDRGQIQSVRDFYDTRKPEKLEDGSSMAEAWMENPHRPMITNICMDPALPPGKNGETYNMWQGFSREPNPDGSCELFWEYVREVLCSGNKVISEYVGKWLAHMVQKPWEKPGTMLVLSGKHGAGKSNLGKIISRLIGSRLVTSFSSKSSFLETHDTTKVHALLVQFEEAFYTNDHAAHQTLKDFITTDRIKLNIKHGAVQDVKNFSRCVMTANKETVVGAEKGERRFVYLDISDKGVRNQPYWDALFNQLDNKGYERLMHELCTADISGFSPMHDKPADFEGNWYMEFKQWIENSDHAIEAWWLHCLVEGGLGTSSIVFSDSPTFIANDALMDSCISYLSTHYKRLDPPRKEVIGQRMRKYREGKKHMENGQYGYFYPGEKTARTLFCTDNHIPGWELLMEKMKV